jgi:hypothetical protein
VRIRHDAPMLISPEYIVVALPVPLPACLRERYGRRVDVLGGNGTLVSSQFQHLIHKLTLSQGRQDEFAHAGSSFWVTSQTTESYPTVAQSSPKSMTNSGSVPN